MFKNYFLTALRNLFRHKLYTAINIGGLAIGVFQHDLEVGNVVLATGWDLFDCTRIPQYGYGRLANVFTSLEFERMCNASGPTGGQSEPGIQPDRPAGGGPKGSDRAR